MAKFLADESVDFRMVTHLREKGFEVQAILENHPGVSDDEVLQIAHESDAILITEDKDFGDLVYRFDHTENTPRIGGWRYGWSETRLVL
jgi:predicted nuclease of predicted toxin-antitoxin system